MNFRYETFKCVSDKVKDGVQLKVGIEGFMNYSS
jgi:hypothetical protein